MPLPNNINAYADVKAVLDPALSRGGATYELETEGQAFRFRARAYKFRALAQKLAAAGNNIKNYQPPTPYDTMLLTVEGNLVHIKIMQQPKGELIFSDGTRLTPIAEIIPSDASPISKAEKEHESALSDELARLVESKGKEDE